MQLKLFAMESSNEFAHRVAEVLDESAGKGMGAITVSKKEEKVFEDGEAFAASLENARGADCFIISSAYQDDKETINDKLMKMFIFIGSLRDASAGRITAVLPYYPYARQDRKTASRAPISTKYLAQLFESVGADRLLTIDAHNPTAIQNAHRINVDLLEAAGLFAKHINNEFKRGKWGKDVKENLVLMSDVGGMNRLRRFRDRLQKYLGVKIDIACVDKLHTNSAEITAERIVGNVKGKFIIVLDDMISSGKTIFECADASRKAGAESLLAVCATHGLFVGKANEYLDLPFVQQFVITDTIKPFRIKNPKIIEKLMILESSHLFAEAIRRTHKSESISDLIENGIHV